MERADKQLEKMKCQSEWNVKLREYMTLFIPYFDNAKTAIIKEAHRHVLIIMSNLFVTNS